MPKRSLPHAPPGVPPDVAALRAQYRRRRRRILQLGGGWTGCVLLSGPLLGFDLTSYLMLGGWVVIGTFSLVTWRCPRCGAGFGRRWFVDACPRCGLQLEE
jgi:hypothetical protein